MTEKHLTDLLQKVLLGTATQEERKMVEVWFVRTNRQENAVWEMKHEAEEQELEANMHKYIVDHISEKKRSPILLSLVRVAASIALFITIGIGYYYLKDGKSSVSTIAHGEIAVGPQAHENRFMVLPDGSTIVLHPGSKINFDFTGKNREVKLFGEAFFDVKHMTNRPFIIHTGKVSTTVLGTAFSIKAYQNKAVVVTVTRGKVSVSGANHKVLAVLTPDRQAEVVNSTSSVTRKTVVSASEIRWVKEDMQFTDMPFGQLAERLSLRYNVSIGFKNDALKNCPITGRFTGTETLEQVIKVITETTTTNFSINGDQVIIDGVGCGNK